MGDIDKVMLWWTLQLLKFDDHRVRRRAIKRLGRSEGEQAVDLLTAALCDQHYLVRKSAAQALGNFGCEQSLGPLIKLAEESRQYAMARIATQSLQQVLSRTAAGATSNDLNKAASLGDINGFFCIQVAETTCFTAAGKAAHWTVDCAPIRRLAHRELVRRASAV